MGDCAASRTALDERCASYKCGVACATDRKCGWSTPAMACIPGEETSLAEYNMGHCADGDMAGILPPKKFCRQALCGATCM
jgi:hypothetical protein